ncbi:MAG: GNAT family N-acetyltransferase [Candidatus Wallacebacter cryptica]
MLEVKAEFADLNLLIEYGKISIAFYVEREYEVVPVENGLGGLLLQEIQPDLPYWVDHDAGESPEVWWSTWDMSKWGVISAFWNGELVGGGIVARDTSGIGIPEGRRDLGLLWDLRVADEFRQRGIGTAVFNACADWSRKQGLKQLRIETQTYNIGACSFYAGLGAVLGAVDCYAYPQHPRIKQLIWYYDL